MVAFGEVVLEVVVFEVEEFVLLQSVVQFGLVVLLVVELPVELVVLGVTAVD